MLVPVRACARRGARRRLDLGELRRRPVDLDRLAPDVLGHELRPGGPTATALPCDMIVTVSRGAGASSM
jgi:hypothetical protein